MKLWIHSQVMHIHCTLFERLKLQTVWPYFNIHTRPWVVHCTSIHIPSSYLSLNMWLSQVLLCSKSCLWGTFHGTNLKCSIVPKTSLIHILKLRHNRGKSIAGSPCGDPGLESCKNPTAIRRLSTPWARIRRRSGKFNLQLKFAGWSADSWGNFAIRRRPPGRCRTSGGDLWATVRFFLGKYYQKSADLRRATVGLSPDDRTEIGRWPRGDLPAA